MSACLVCQRARWCASSLGSCVPCWWPSWLVNQHPALALPVADERSLGFWALGYGRASGRPAVVITSSGTAVANLLPAVVEVRH